MPGPLRLAAIAVIAALIIISLAFLASDRSTTEASHTGGMGAMSIDVNITGNSARSLGPLDSCMEASPGDTVTVDVTATNIPAETAMIGFTYTIQYDESRVWVETKDHQFLLAAGAGSALFNWSDPTPDHDFNNTWSGGAADLSDYTVVPPEYGSGVLTRLTISISQGAPNGMYSLTLMEAGHVDTGGEGQVAEAVNGAAIALGLSCPALEGTPTPAPTPTRLPTPTPKRLPISVSFDPAAQLRLPDGSVTIRGSVTCSESSSVHIEVIEVFIQQSVKEGALAAGPASGPITCNGQMSWSATVMPEFGRFRPGDAEAVVVAFAPGSGSVGASGPVHLKPGAIK